MNILFISALLGSRHAGPTYSVPQQINSIMSVANVHWINFKEVEDESVFDLNTDYNYCNPLRFNFDKLKKPFNKPDLVVVEEFFKLEYVSIVNQMIKKKIPYIIIPRCQMTEKYLFNKKIKKKIADFIFFNKMSKNATAVQFLSKQEYLDSKKYYNGKSFIIPNGIKLYELKSDYDKNNKNSYNGVFIGRYNVWQKGLDILVEAVFNLKDQLKKNGIKIHLYGPESKSGSRKDIDNLVHKFGVEDLIEVNGPIFNAEKTDVLQKADFFIHTSRFEGLPMSVLEAMANSLPCLVTNGTNIRNEIENANAGWGADDDVHSVEKAFLILIKELNILDKKNHNAYKLAKSYSWDSIAKNWFEEISILI